MRSGSCFLREGLGYKGVMTDDIYGMGERGSCVAFDLGKRAVLRFSGKDRVRYLNGQVTQDIRNLKESNALPFCVVSAKGRMQAIGMATNFGDWIALDFDEGQEEVMEGRFGKYIISDEVELECGSGGWRLFHIVGAENGLDTADGAKCFRSKRLGVEGWDVWVLEEGVKGFIDGHKLRLGSDEEWEKIRILRGIPRWGMELGEETLPPEAGLEGTHIDYHKGCYIGQEVISRLRSVGHVNRHLVVLEGDRSDGVPQVGSELRVRDAAVGKVTSVLSCESGRVTALGYLKRGVEDTQFECAGGGLLRLRQYAD